MLVRGTSKELTSRSPGGVEGLFLSDLSKDFVGDVLLLGVPELFSSIILMSRTEPEAIDCSLR